MIRKDGQQMVQLIEQQFFGPVLGLNPDSLPPHQREAATEMRSELAGVHQRLTNAGSVEELTREFGKFAAARSSDLDPQLSEFGLPTLGDLRYDVEKTAAELGLHWQDDEPGQGPRGRRQDA